MTTHGHVDVWYIDLDDDESQPADREILSEDEWDRASRFHLQVHRRRFVAARAALRRIVAREAVVDPAAIRFRSGPFGKPELDVNPSDIRFSLSHADGRAAIAVCRHFDVGIDLEPVRPMNDCERLA